MEGQDKQNKARHVWQGKEAEKGRAQQGSTRQATQTDRARKGIRKR
jgi:hypothetical protein